MSGEGAAIEVLGLTKNFGSLRAVDDLGFVVQPGSVTGFLGPNGAGKTTTLRMLLGLVTPDAGSATIGGRRYAELPDPTRTVGAALEASGFHPGRRARDHIRVICRGAGLPDARVDEVLAQVGLSDAASRRVGGFSMGMRQRLALAAALVGDPQVLVLDEPANGLDPEGIAWLRGFLRFLADQGRTVLISSHVLSEVAQTVDQVVIIARGRLVRQSRLSDLTVADGVVRVRTPDGERLRRAVSDQGYASEPGEEPDVVLVSGTDCPTIGRIALREKVELHELTAQRSDLEQVFLDLTAQGGGLQ